MQLHFKSSQRIVKCLFSTASEVFLFTLPGDETAIGSNDTTLVESESVSSNDPENPGVQKQARVSFCENLVIHNGSREENGLTKTEDGAQTLHKSLLQQNPLLTCDTFFEDPNPAPNGNVL